MDTIFLIVSHAAAALAGLGGYRYWLKSDPEGLEAWAKKIKAAGQKIG